MEGGRLDNGLVKVRSECGDLDLRVMAGDMSNTSR